MTFHVGQKVVCVSREKGPHASYPNTLPLPPELKAGAVYTIREIDDWYAQFIDEPGVRLDELRFPSRECAWGMVEPAFAASRFRPVIERSTETGMEILRSLLTPLKQDETVR